MKFLAILLSITIVAVSGNAISKNGGEDGGAAEAMKYMAAIDPAVRSKILKAAQDQSNSDYVIYRNLRTRRPTDLAVAVLGCTIRAGRTSIVIQQYAPWSVIAASGKTVNEKVREIAVLTQKTADEWKDFVKNYKGNTPTEEEQQKMNDQLRSDMVAFAAASKNEKTPESEKFYAALDADIKLEIENEPRKTHEVMIDPSKTLQEKYNATTTMVQRMADLWKQAAEKLDSTPASS